MFQRPRGSEEPGSLAWAGSSEKRTAPWGLLNPRGPRTIAPRRTLACAQSCRRPRPTSPHRLPQASRYIAEVAQHYPQRRRRVKRDATEDAGILRPCSPGHEPREVGRICGVCRVPRVTSWERPPVRFQRQSLPGSYPGICHGETGCSVGRSVVRCWGRTSIPDQLVAPRCGIPSETSGRLFPNSGPHGRATVATHTRCAVLLRVPKGLRQSVRSLELVLLGHPGVDRRGLDPGVPELLLDDLEVSGIGRRIPAQAVARLVDLDAGIRSVGTLAGGRPMNRRRGGNVAGAMNR
jgi:hypothetical protein